ncbi:hypothetical protein Pyn_02766 [Prunus yedoensis var. nudiflora]|uniref:Uncharacterized protein n=1 Tax=Prunus yedoensis var. nudiflora TaxID=2094558 RepID=A0A314YIM5_PRUYE|nr:hypothetical protein Pyn_02766 [Prunus yedoensis var. nudiflora]
MKLPLEYEFRDQAPRMLRKGCKALGNTLVTFTNENNGCLQINSWLGMRSLCHGSKIDMSLAPKRKLSVPGDIWVLRKGILKRGLVGKGGKERKRWLGRYFWQLDSDSVKCQNSMTKGKAEGGDELSTKIAGFCMQERKLALWLWMILVGWKRPYL